MVAQTNVVEARFARKACGTNSPVLRARAWRGLVRTKLRKAISPGLQAVTLNRVNAALGVLIALTAGGWVVSALGAALNRTATIPVICVKVRSGDTLWSVASRYGNPDEYILQRVDTLATENHIQPGTRLQAGTVLRVRVENPDMRDHMMTASAR
jgi:hypothetical protein